MEILDTSNLPDSLTKNQQAALYNGMDVLATRAVFDNIHPLLSGDTLKTYEFSRALQGPVLDMMEAGCHVDFSVRGKLIEEWLSKKERLTLILERMAEALGYKEYFTTRAFEKLQQTLSSTLGDKSHLLETIDDPKTKREIRSLSGGREALAEYSKAISFYSKGFNGGSPKQKAELLFDLRKFGGSRGPVGLPPPLVKDKVTEQMKVSTARESLTPLLEKGFPANFIIKTVLALSDADKTLGFLKCILEKGVFRSTFHIGGTETGRFSSTKNPQGFGWNAQNVDKDLRLIFTTPIGEKFGAVDLEQAESRVVGAICFRLFGDEDYINAQESGDPHSLVCSLIWPKLGWPSEFSLDGLKKYGVFPKDVVIAARKVANQIFYRGFSYRDLAKSAAHGTNYGGRAKTIALHLHVPVELAEHFQKEYFCAFPAIKKWHLWVAEQLQTTRQITTLLGRRRIFFSRPTDDSTLREAIAFEPQSVATGDYTNRALLSIWNEAKAGRLPITLFLQKHDELGFRFNEEDEDLVVPEVVRLMQPEILLRSPSGKERIFKIPAAPKTGWNLADYSEKNPDGLKSFYGQDSRKRGNQPCLSILETLQ